MQDSLVTVQRALAVVYEDAYPCSNRVRQGLEGILNTKYGGSQHEFTINFITPTISLLKRLKEKVHHVDKRMLTIENTKALISA